MSIATIIKGEPARQQKNKLAAIKESFPVLEMTCASCAISVESMLKSVNGVSEAGVNFANQTAWVQYDPDIVTPKSCKKQFAPLAMIW